MDGRIGNLLKKTQCERGDISLTQTKEFFLIFPIEDGRIKHLERNKDLRTSTLVLGESERCLPQLKDSFPDVCEARNDFGPCQETSYTSITLNPESTFTRQEKNHSLFHCNTLTYPELLIRI